MVLYEMGQVDKSLQVFLHCLALDESFPCAKRHVENVSKFGLSDGLPAVMQSCVKLGSHKCHRHTLSNINILLHPHTEALLQC